MKSKYDGKQPHEMRGFDPNEEVYSMGPRLTDAQIEENRRTREAEKTMPSENWTPRFGERVRVITVGGKNPLAVVLDPQVDSEGRAIYSVRFAHGQTGDYYASELEPAPDPAVAKLLKAAQYFRNGYESFLGMTVESEHADFIDSFAAKGGAE